MRTRLSFNAVVSLLVLKQASAKSNRISSGSATVGGSPKSRQRKLKIPKKPQEYETNPPNEIPDYYPYYSIEPMGPPPDLRYGEINHGTKLRLSHCILTFFGMLAVVSDLY